jgi:hypothetical protein
MGDRRGRKLRQKSSGPKGPTRQEGERNLGPQRERTPCEAPKWLPTRNGSWGIEQPSPSRKGEGQWTAVKVTGQCSRRLLRRIDGGTKGMVDDPKQGRSRDCEAAGASREARPEVIARLADRVVVAKRPRDSITLAEQRTRGAAACSMTRRRTRHARHAETTGDPRRVAKGSTEDASNSLARKGAPERIVRSCCLEAVLGKTRRTEF